ncbi:MAG: ABC transporter ATP-binding protein [Candidatus Rokuibacteriota bacterium]
MQVFVAPFRRLGPYLRPHVATLAVGGLCAVVAGAMEGAIAWLVKPAMDEIFIRRDLFMLTLVPLAVLGAYVVKGLGTYLQWYLMASAGQRVVARLRRDLFLHIQAMPLAFFSGTHSAELMSRVLNDVSRLARLSSTVLVQLVRHTGTVVALVTVMLIREPLLTLAALVTFPLIALVVQVVGRRLYRINKREQEQVAELAIFLQESFIGAKIVKIFGRERDAQGRFDGLNERLLRLSLKNIRTDHMTQPLLEIASAVAIVGILFYGGYQVITGARTPGVFFSFIAAVIMLYGPARQLARMINAIQQTTGSVERVFEILDAPSAVQDRPGARRLEGFHYSIAFEGVSFEYPNAQGPVLRDINLTIARGEVVAFVGLSGAGKSTLLDLLPRFHDVGAGRIAIDGHDVRDVTQSSLRALMGVVTQETFLFSGSILDNVRYGRPHASLEEVVEASRLAHAHEFVQACPQGYDTLVGERGVRLSGGQRQRIAIARAFLRNPPILILDEATSDLDAESEFIIQQALADLMKGRTVLVIAHRFATVRTADRIVVIDEGSIVDVGRHDELLARTGVYRRLHALQMEGVRT